MIRLSRAHTRVRQLSRDKRDRELRYRLGWNNLINKFFEARVTAQRVEHRFDLDVRNAAGFIGAVALFQPVQCFVLFVQGEINQGNRVVLDRVLPLQVLQLFE